MFVGSVDSETTHVYFITGRMQATLYDLLGNMIAKETSARGSVVGLFAVGLSDRSHLQVQATEPSTALRLALPDLFQLTAKHADFQIAQIALFRVAANVVKRVVMVDRFPLGGGQREVGGRHHRHRHQYKYRVFVTDMRDPISFVVHQLRKLAHERPKQILQVGLQRRYSQFYQTAKQAIDKGMIAQVTHINTQWNRNPGWTMKPDPVRQRALNWRLFREYSGGLTAELGSHQIDVADWIYGSSPEYVTSVGGLDVRKDGRDVYDNIQLIYKYPKGQKEASAKLEAELEGSKMALRRGAGALSERIAETILSRRPA